MKTKLVALCLVTIAAIGCDKASAAPQITCEQVAPYMNSLIVASQPEAERAKATADLAADLPKTIADCKTKNMSQEAMKCLMDAKAPADFGKCK